MFLQVTEMLLKSSLTTLSKSLGPMEPIMRTRVSLICLILIQKLQTMSYSYYSRVLHATGISFIQSRSHTPIMYVYLLFTNACKQNTYEVLLQKLQEDDMGYDVLKDYQHRNRVPKLPACSTLVSEDDEKDEAQLDTEAVSEDGSETNNPRRLPRHSNTPFKSRSRDPTQLHFYSDQWQEVLTDSKMRYRLHLASIWAFPKSRTDANEAKVLKSCITEAIAQYETEGYKLEAGKCNI